MSDRLKGFVKWFDAKKEYGFINVDDQEGIFVHFSNIDIIKISK